MTILSIGALQRRRGAALRGRSQAAPRAGAPAEGAAAGDGSRRGEAAGLRLGPRRDLCLCRRAWPAPGFWRQGPLRTTKLIIIVVVAVAVAVAVVVI